MGNILEVKKNPYIELFDNNLNSDSNEDVVMAIGLLNVKEQLSEASGTLENDSRDIVAFAKYFCNKYKDTPSVWGDLFAAYLGTPRIFVVAEHFGYKNE